MRPNLFLDTRQCKFWTQKQQSTKIGRYYRFSQHGKRSKSKAKKRSSSRHQEWENHGRTVLFANLLNLCYLKIRNWNRSSKNTKPCRTTRRCGDRRLRLVYSVHRARSQMTAAKVLDKICRLPGCAGQASDAVSAYAQVKMEEAPKFVKHPELERPTCWTRLPRSCCPKFWDQTQEFVVTHQRTFVRAPIGRTVSGAATGKGLDKTWIGEGSWTRQLRCCRHSPEQPPQKLTL